MSESKKPGQIANTETLFSKCSQNQLNISKFLPPKRRKTLRSY